MMEELNKLLIKNTPNFVIAAFQTTTKLWLRIKLESEYSGADEIANMIGKHPFYVKNIINQLRDTSPAKLSNLRKALNKAEFQIKSGDIKADLALEMALVK